MPAFPLVRRADAPPSPSPSDDSSTSNEDVVNLSMAILGLLFAVVLLASALLCLRRVRRQRALASGLLPPRYDADAEALPPYQDLRTMTYHPAAARAAPGCLSEKQGHQRVTIRSGRSSVQVVAASPMLSDPAAPPHSPGNVPQIHITFPDEQDEETGAQRSGRVVLVRVGERGGVVGLEPVRGEEQLPAYERESKNGFVTLDMDRMGGLKEKEFC